MRVIVCGGRDYADVQEVRFVCMALPPDTVVVHGAQRGADLLTEQVWREDFGGITEPHEADWHGPCRASCRPGHRRIGRYGRDYCPAAGNYRNQDMLDTGDIDRTIALPGGTGTADMMRRSLRAGVPVKRAGIWP